jgi:PAS domain S-box-containing protein
VSPVSTPGATPGLTSVRLLLVEDSENDAMLLLRELRRGGYEPVYERVYTPEDMRLALEGAEGRGEPFDVVVSDYYMPRFRAPDALELLRKLGYDVPFIVVSGKIGEDAAVGIMKAGANDYLTKENMARLCPAIEREIKEAEVRRERERAEAALSRSEDRFRRLVEQAADAVFVHDLEGRLVDVNREACESLGYTRRELLGMSVSDVEVGISPGSLRGMWDRIVSGPPITIEGLARRKDGTTFPVEVRVGVFESGEQTLFLALVRDVSGRKEAEEELRRSEERYRTFISQSSEGIWRFELEEPMPTELPEEQQLDHLYRHAYLAECNDVMARMYGFDDASGLVGARVGDLLPRSEPENVAFLRKVLHGGYRLKDGESQELDRGGGARIFVNNVTGIVEDGRVVRVWGTQRDVTEQKEAEETLVRLASFPELNPNPILETSLAGEPTYLNPAAQARFPDIRELGPRHPALADLGEVNRRIWSAGGRPFAREVRVGERRFQQAISRTPEGEMLRIYSVDVTERRRAEEALRQSEERFRSLVQNASDIILILDKDGAISYESPAVEHVLGFKPEERIGVNAFDLIHPEDRPKVARAFQDYRDVSGPFPPVEYRVMDKEGSWRHLEAIGENLLEDPVIQGIVVNSRDVTERRRTEQALRESRESLQAILDYTTAVIYVKDAEGRYVLVNRRFEDMFGVGKEDVVGRNDHDVFSKAAAQEYRRNDLQVLRSEASLEAEETARHADGSVHTYFSVKFPLKGPDGTPYATCGISTDITSRKRTEQELRASEERFRATFDQAAVGITQVGLDGRWLRVNRRLCEIVGYDEDELLGLGFQEITHPEDLEKDLAHLKRLVAGEIDTFSMEKRYLRKNGSIVWVYLTVSIVREPSVGSEYLIGVVEDITDRRRAEDALREAEERYRTLVEGLPAVTYVRHVGSDVLSYASPQLEAALGYSPEEYLADPDLFAQTVHPDDRGWVLAEDRRTDRTGEVYSVECRRITKDGRVVWVHDEAHLVRDAGGEPLYWQGFLTDITDRRRAEEALRQSEELYRTVVEQAAESIFMLDLDTLRVLEANAALGETLGYEPEELKGMSFYDISAHDRESIDRNAGRVVREGRLSIGARQYRRKDGGLADVEISLSIVPYDGRPAMCVVAHDVTERRRAERALGEIREAERNRIARELHDSILQDIVYALQEIQILQATGPDGGTLNDAADALRRSVEGLRAAIFDLRLNETLGRSFVSSMEGLVDLNRRMARGAYELELVVGDGVPRGLPEQGGREIVRIVQEALTNVRRHAGATRVRVEIGVVGDDLYAEIRDDGRGFDPGGSGTGMGRYSMRRRALDIGGEVEILSEPGVGTRVICRVPLARMAGEVSSGGRDI